LTFFIHLGQIIAGKTGRSRLNPIVIIFFRFFGFGKLFAEEVLVVGTDANNVRGCHLEMIILNTENY